MRFTKKRLDYLFLFMPRLSDEAKAAVEKICVRGEEVSKVASVLGLSTQGIGKNVRKLEILDLKLSSAFSTSTLLHELAHKLLMIDCEYSVAVKILSDVCFSLGGVVKRNVPQSGEYTFELENVGLLIFLNQFHEPNRLWDLHSYDLD